MNIAAIPVSLLLRPESPVATDPAAGSSTDFLAQLQAVAPAATPARARRTAPPANAPQPDPSLQTPPPPIAPIPTAPPAPGPDATPARPAGAVPEVPQDPMHAIANSDPAAPAPPPEADPVDETPTPASEATNRTAPAAAQPAALAIAHGTQVQGNPSEGKPPKGRQFEGEHIESEPSGDPLPPPGANPISPLAIAETSSAATAPPSGRQRPGPPVASVALAASGEMDAAAPGRQRPVRSLPPAGAAAVVGQRPSPSRPGEAKSSQNPAAPEAAASLEAPADSRAMPDGFAARPFSNAGNSSSFSPSLAQAGSFRNEAAADPLPAAAEPGEPAELAARSDALLADMGAGLPEGFADVVISLSDAAAIDVTLAAHSEASADRLQAESAELQAELVALGTEVEAIRVELRPERVPDARAAGLSAGWQGQQQGNPGDQGMHRSNLAVRTTRSDSMFASPSTALGTGTVTASAISKVDRYA